MIKTFFSSAYLKSFSKEHNSPPSCVFEVTCLTGFGERIQYVHTNKDDLATSSSFVCCKEGLRKPDKRDYKTIKPRAV